ncbi:MAG: hypothetical protein RL308_3264 [Bacteroidota bacterium]|jgi:hypothetical protein
MKGKVRVTAEQSILLQIEFIKKGFVFMNGSFEPFCKDFNDFFYFDTKDVGRKGEPFRIISNGTKNSIETNRNFFNLKVWDGETAFLKKRAKEYTFNECLSFIENYKVK